MRNRARMIATLTAAGALLALPAAGLAAKGGNSAKAKAKVTAKAKAKAKAKSCTLNVGYQVGGTLVSIDANTIVLSVTSANAHARRSGELKDQNTTANGLQVKGALVTIARTGTDADAFTLRLKGYEGADTASAGDKVKVSGKIAVTKKHCADTGTSTADRYAAPNVKRVTISDRDADA